MKVYGWLGIETWDESHMLVVSINLQYCDEQNEDLQKLADVSEIENYLKLVAVNSWLGIESWDESHRLVVSINLQYCDD